MAKIAALTSPLSGLNKKGAVNHSALDEIVKDCGIHIRAGTPEELNDAIAWIRGNDVDIVAANSGDGFIHKLVTRMMHAYSKGERKPLLAPLQGGTINFVASALRAFDSNILKRHVLMKSPPEQILERLVEEYAHTPREKIPHIKRKLLRVVSTDPETGCRQELYGFIFANGIVANFMEQYYDVGGLIESPGPAQAFNVIAKSVASVLGRHVNGKARGWYDDITKRLEMSVAVDGDRLDYDKLIGTAIASMDLSLVLGPLSMQPFYGINCIPKNFHIIGGDMPILQIVKNLPNLFLGRPMKMDKYIDTKVRKVDLLSDKPSAYTIDGDMYHAEGDISIDAHKTLNFVARQSVFF